MKYLKAVCIGLAAVVAGVVAGQSNGHGVGSAGGCPVAIVSPTNGSLVGCSLVFVIQYGDVSTGTCVDLIVERACDRVGKRFYGPSFPSGGGAGYWAPSVNLCLAGLPEGDYLCRAGLCDIVEHMFCCWSDDLQITFATGVVNGHFDLEDCANPEGLVAEVVYRLPNTKTVVCAIPTVLDANGNFSGTPAPKGTYDVAVKVANWLRRVLPTQQIGDSAFSLNMAMLNGDADGDNDVDLRDLGLVLLNFDTPGPEGDLNRDGHVGLADLALVLLEYNQKGDS